MIFLGHESAYMSYYQLIVDESETSSHFSAHLYVKEELFKIYSVVHQVERSIFPKKPFPSKVRTSKAVCWVFVRLCFQDRFNSIFNSLAFTSSAMTVCDAYGYSGLGCLF